MNVRVGVPVIRPMRHTDELALGQIAYQTGFFGQSAAAYFPSPALFSLLWIRPYFHGAGSLGFVAELDGQAVGYIIGSVSQGQYQSALTKTVLQGGWRTLPAPLALLICLRYLLRAALFSAPHASWQEYPAHLHINLLPQARGLRLGEQLLRAYLSALMELGVPGVQLSTTTQNSAALGLYREFGFRVLAEKTTPLWTPWLGHPARHVIMGCRLAKEPG